MDLYDLTLKKEVARECAWGVMGAISRIENKKGESPILKIIEKNFWEEVRKIPKMSSVEVDTLNINSKFMIKILSELEEM
ncbi:hypothetical protein [Fusobacterium animalis]|uniref:hypothetical protein n=1 Tax=Fusobacterium animalis TaxID=76859 RepID=UPI0034DF55F1